MAYDLHVIHAGDFVELEAGGRVDLPRSRRVLSDLARAMVARGLGRAILDVRGVEGALTITELYSLASTFHEAGFRRGDRLAIVHHPNRIDRADFFATCATNRGWNVASFDAFEDALRWLATAEPLDPAALPGRGGDGPSAPRLPPPSSPDDTS